MTNSKTTKRTLLFSVFAIVLCIAMLIGTTFAWFTDTASTDVNKIQSGRLDVDIQNEAGKSISNLEWFAKDGRAQSEIFWEPGCTYTLTPFKIVNTGNLALKYKLVVTGLDGDSELLDVIKFTYNVGEEMFDISKEGHLAPNGGSTGMITVSAHMDEAAGNKYMEKELNGVKITVYATQDTVESDSFDNQYDKNATYFDSATVGNNDDLKSALDQKVSNITIDGYYEGDKTKTSAADRLTIKAPTVFNINAAMHIPGSLEDSDNWAVLFINAETTINASPGGGIYCSDKVDADNPSYIGGPYVAHIDAPGATVTVNGGFYHGGGTIFNVQRGTLVINGGFYQVTPDIGTKDYRYTLNCIDSAYKNGTANIIVKGGTFVNFDPSNNLAEGANTNFVADGYKVESEVQSNGDIYYTVVPE